MNTEKKTLKTTQLYARLFLIAINFLLLNTVIGQDFILRKYYGAKYEPKDGVIHGAGQDPQSFKEYTKAIGQNFHPKMYMTYVNVADNKEVDYWTNSVVNDFKNLPKDVMPQIGLSFVVGNNAGVGLDKQLSEGQYDANLEKFYNTLKSINRPSYVRIGFEFEGSWNDYTPYTFKKAFRKITNELRSRNVKAATVWCSAGGSQNFVSQNRLMDFYPGDEYVDWWGIDIFSPEEFSNWKLNQFYKLADDHGKPVMIGETTPRYVGVTDGQNSWNKWFKPYFEGIEKNPGIKATSYINWDWLYWSNAINFPWHDWGDARIQKNYTVQQNYKREISKSYYIHAGSFDPEVKIPTEPITTIGGANNNIFSPGNIIAIKGSNSRYLSSENGKSYGMTCINNNVGDYEKFTVVNAGNGLIALKGNNGAYVCSEDGSYQGMSCNRFALKGWEKFDPVFVAKGVYGFRANNGKYVSSESGRQSITANRDVILAWEKFEVFKVGTVGKKSTVPNNSQEATILAYPNPANSTINIDLAQRTLDGEASVFQIYDLLGRLMSTKSSNEAITTLNISELNAGRYFVNVISDNTISKTSFTKR